MNETTRLKNIKRAQRWYENNKERAKKTRKLYDLRMKDKLSEMKRRRYRKNPEKFREAQRSFNAKNPWYCSYQSARARCTNPKATGYKWYGGRGIKFLLTLKEVVFLWRRDCANLMKAPSIDRIDADRDYIFSNCRWIERSENSRITALKNHALKRW